VSVDRTAAEVAEYIRNFISGEGGKWDWDDFESLSITNPDLERIRQEAFVAAPPNLDLVKLADLARQAEALAKS
jgi:hypothetical protein